MDEKPEQTGRYFDPDTHPRAELVDTTDWFLKLKRTEKELVQTKKEYVLAQHQIDEMNAVFAWCLKILEMVYQKRNIAANQWLGKALEKYPWLESYLTDKRVDTDRLIDDPESEQPESS